MNANENVIAVVGGDEREQEIARLAAASGAEVRAFGFPVAVGGIEGVALSPDLVTAVAGATHLVLPIPGIASDGTIFAPAATAPIRIDVALLDRMRAPRVVICGAADEELRSAVAATGASLHEYEHDRELMLLRTPAIVEGAIRATIESTRITIDANRAIVIGHGNIGARLAVTLAALGARVTVVARSPIQRAAAAAAHLDTAALEDLAVIAEGVPMLFSTVPSRVVGSDVLAVLAEEALVMDLAAPPGGIDLDAATAMGHVAVWARGLGRRAPVTVGRSQWGGIRRIIEADRGGHA